MRFVIFKISIYYKSFMDIRTITQKKRKKTRTTIERFKLQNPNQDNSKRK